MGSERVSELMRMHGLIKSLSGRPTGNPLLNGAHAQRFAFHAGKYLRLVAAGHHKMDFVPATERLYGGRAHGPKALAPTPAPPAHHAFGPGDPGPGHDGPLAH